MPILYFYEILQSIMDEKGLSISEVARLSKLPDSTVRSILSRKNKTVALEVAFKLAKGLDVSLERLNGEQMPGRAEGSQARKRLRKEVDILPEGQLHAVSAFIKYLKEEGQES